MFEYVFLGKAGSAFFASSTKPLSIPLINTHWVTFKITIQKQKDCAPWRREALQNVAFLHGKICSLP